MSFESMASWGVDREWALFLDRDGVINRRLIDDYVRNWSEFEFLPNTLATLAKLADKFKRIVIITNQRGIARHLMSEADLADVHERMRRAVQEMGGRIDGIYHCPHDRTDGCSCRKPATGLALRAKAEFEDIDFSRSIMVGDSASDMEFAARAGLRKVWVGPKVDNLEPMPDAVFASLSDFYDGLMQAEC